MKKNFDLGFVAKLAPIAFAALVAAAGAIKEQKEQEKIDSMEERIAQLEEEKKEN